MCATTPYRENEKTKSNIESKKIHCKEYTRILECIANREKKTDDGVAFHRTEEIEIKQNALHHIIIIIVMSIKYISFAYWAEFVLQQISNRDKEGPAVYISHITTAVEQQQKCWYIWLWCGMSKEQMSFWLTRYTIKYRNFYMLEFIILETIELSNFNINKIWYHCHDQWVMLISIEWTVNSIIFRFNVFDFHKCSSNNIQI